jgi:hypothetical protein
VFLIRLLLRAFAYEPYHPLLADAANPDCKIAFKSLKDSGSDLSALLFVAPGAILHIAVR